MSVIITIGHWKKLRRDRFTYTKQLTLILGISIGTCDLDDGNDAGVVVVTLHNKI